MISIIMPIFNRDYAIEETLDSILNQTYQDWECIIVDDGSTDKTVELIESWSLKDSRFIIFERPNYIPKGPSGCRNFAISKSKGNFIQFFDSDDIMHPEHLTKKIDVLGDNDFSICKIKEFSDKFSKSDFGFADAKNLLKTDSLFKDFVTGKFPVFMVAPLWKKDSLKPYLPLREDLHILEDHELYARAFAEVKNYAVVNEYLIYYRVGHGSSTGSFYSNVASGLDSFLEAKATVLGLTNDKDVKLAVLKMTLGFFRQALAERNFIAAQKCLDFTKEFGLWESRKLVQARILLAYNVFKVIRKGDTRFKSYFKI